MIQTENLIIGLGIAGINLCHQLEKAGKSFLVIDNCPTNSASLIAGGIYNPVVLKRKVKSWNVDRLFPALIDTYRELETVLGDKFLEHDFPILKPISSVDEITEWQQAVAEKRIAPFVSSVEETPPAGPFQDNVIGSVTIDNSGFLRIRKLVLAYRNYLKEKGLLIEKQVRYSSFKLNGDSIIYENVTSERIIFSEGRFISENPFFSWLPYNLTKGQMLTVKVNTPLGPSKIYNQQFLFFPTEEKDIFRLGATYSWNEADEEPTKEATQELLEKVKKALDIDLEVLDAQAAIRPTVADRRPTIGAHPNEKNVFLFNGMGSKGVMLAPTFAKELVGLIYKGKQVNPEVDLNRFIKRYKKSLISS
ncbi:FAD-binding oxidoreductase [Flavobacteriales bacterium]|nr:FAD-binding oxidoreductase [Flavobacteriales bacterium]